MIRSFVVSRNLFLLSVFASLTLMLTSCARKIRFDTSPIVPAATGRVKIKKDRNDNYAINIKIQHLAEASRLDTPRDTYVVWMETDRDGTKNLGQITSSTRLLGSKQRASLDAVSPFRPRRVFITAEHDAAVPYPGVTMVLTTRSFSW